MRQLAVLCVLLVTVSAFGQQPLRVRTDASCQGECAEWKALAISNGEKYLASYKRELQLTTDYNAIYAEHAGFSALSQGNTNDYNALVNDYNALTVRFNSLLVLAKQVAASNSVSVPSYAGYAPAQKFTWSNLVRSTLQGGMNAVANGALDAPRDSTVRCTSQQAGDTTYTTCR
jgi:hypothetical protein